VAQDAVIGTIWEVRPLPLGAILKRNQFSTSREHEADSRTLALHLENTDNLAEAAMQTVFFISLPSKVSLLCFLRAGKSDAFHLSLNGSFHYENLIICFIRLPLRIFNFVKNANKHWAESRCFDIIRN
jgi:hypothetical protein